MERKPVTEAELLSYLNNELHKNGHHENCHFDYLIRLKVDDRTGCNWAYANFTCTGEEGDKICPTDSEKIVAKARARFNLK